MYNTNSHPDRYCLFSSYMSSQFTGHHKTRISAHQTTAYCLRPLEGNNPTTDFDNGNITDPSITFSELKQSNITSHNLLSWSVSIDLAEQYQIYLYKNSNSTNDKKELFYNCTSPWFGPLCRFKFHSSMDVTFDDIVERTFKSKSRVKYDANVTCYEHLHCQTLLSCLTWHEICDGKHDCLDGSDESNCWQLEVNQCGDNEFRCHNGQCIPIEFLRDDLSIADCLDRTDEPVNQADYSDCYIDASFRCEEHICHVGNDEFPCRDGECTDRIGRCYNGRTSFLAIDLCTNATACSLTPIDQVDTRWCRKFCSDRNCLTNKCPSIYEFRYIPVLLGHVRFLYIKKIFDSDRFPTPDYICYDEQRCVDFPSPSIQLNNFTCRHFNDTGLGDIESYDNIAGLIENVKIRFRLCTRITDEMHCSNQSTMYQCRNSSKCISTQRLLDGIQDCMFNDDETFDRSCSLNDIHQRFKCSNYGHDQCFAALTYHDGKKNCVDGADERQESDQQIKNQISFQTICDGKQELLPVLIDKRNETDETECEHWLCNNTYSRCDQFWLCPNGADEVDCSPSTCPVHHHHQCVLPNDTTKISCLPINQAGDGINDCLGGTDERDRYHVGNYNYVSYYFQCLNDTQLLDIDRVCDSKVDCRFNDDETFCTGFSSMDKPFCLYPPDSFTDAGRFLCDFVNSIRRHSDIYFKLGNVQTYSSLLEVRNNSITELTRVDTRSPIKSAVINIHSTNPWECHRGVSVYLRVYANETKLYCLCPPSYYGHRCQYQNQRVSITMQIRMISNWRDVFIVIITLIDEKRLIESHDHIEYLSVRDCRTKFNVYLIYSTRPKNSLKNYSVQIDMYNQFRLTYRASWRFPLRFPFLPVHRLPVFLKVPFTNSISVPEKCRPPCVHGQCFTYINDQRSTFCQCESGWFGVQCNDNHTCDCASDSLCISHSICLCPRDQFGPRCYLTQLSCRSKPCMNSGQCIPTDARIADKHSSRFTCICAEGFAGDHCQYRQQQSRIDICFHREVVIPSSLILHLIAVQPSAKPNRTSLMKKIAFDQYSLTVYTSSSFHMAFAQISKHFYLIILQQRTITLSHLSTEIKASHRCRSLHELFNETFASQHLLKRIKYYHIPCQQLRELVCFHDDVHLCLCTSDRRSNCFDFDFDVTYDCGGENFCEHEGLCFQDDPKCPTSAFCACRQCYFGSLCQFSSKGSTLSLDTILIYHIVPHTGVSQQPTIVKTAIVFASVMFIFGVTISFFSFQTFRREQTRTTGCGLYLFTSSIISMLIITIFVFKFCFLLVSQMGLITNRLFLYVQCMSMDYLLQFLMSTSDWLSACVAIERAVTVLQGIKFNKVKSRQMAKRITAMIFLCTSATLIYDPIHRRLADDDEEQRTWCVVKYSPTTQIVDWLLNIFHFAIPFAINCISGIFIIVNVARSRSKSQTTKSFKEHLREQVYHHKHLLISSTILVIMAIPRLIISFLSGCMESARDSWFYLIGYFISFLPPIMTFVVYVLPSAVYRKQFRESFKGIW